MSLLGAGIEILTPERKKQLIEELRASAKPVPQPATPSEARPQPASSI